MVESYEYPKLVTSIVPDAIGGISLQAGKNHAELGELNLDA
jgi:hypothetical protein